MLYLTVDSFYIPVALCPIRDNCEFEGGAVGAVVMVNRGDIHCLLVGAQAGVATDQGGAVVI